MPVKKSGLPVNSESYFGGPAYAVGDAEPLIEFVDGKPAGQQHDKDTGKPLWTVRVFDTDPEAPKGQGEVTVKVVAATPPALPAELPGLPFRPVIFDDLVVVPYVKEGSGRPRVAYSLRASGIRPAASRKTGDS
ncbi:hypothetical protein [Plantibacter sp. MMLR14_011]|uniref:hypothetical protein n=1 Tax=Plantibacter sp. MMLR14_011 TaxID=1898746 RepID=UPI0008DDA652|nr:hypothetical protein [Plantibacter sp. MMLR14_011]OII41454.1 hypothetical protein BIU99_17850 [Plantibacter sp. MMLR14_011]